MNESKGNMATQFIRANDGAELTLSHDVHGDTEYRYDVEGSGPDAILTAYKVHRDWPTDGAVHLEGIFSGMLVKFFEEYKPGWGDEFHPFKPVAWRYGGTRVLNLTTAAQLLDGEHGPLHHLRIWGANGVMTRTAANWVGRVEEIKAIVEAFPELMTDEIRGFLSPVVVDA
jgi:hypothetical protein